MTLNQPNSFNDNQNDCKLQANMDGYLSKDTWAVSFVDGLECIKNLVEVESGHVVDDVLEVHVRVLTRINSCHFNTNFA